MPSHTTEKPHVRARGNPRFRGREQLSAVEAKQQAQLIAFGPVVFKLALALRNLGVLDHLQQGGSRGLSFAELEDRVSLSAYGLRVLVDGGVQSGLVVSEEGRFFLSSTGYFVLNDSMTRVNLDFVNDVWYRGLEHLEEAIETGKPAGLKELGSWPTIYHGLSELPERTRNSWLAFDHFYSDDAFAAALPLVLRDKPARLLDIGGNTGKFSLECVRHDPDVEVTIVDLPGQISLARRNVVSDAGASRIHFHPADMLATDLVLPEGFDVIWMSQFLDCFSQNEIVRILSACRVAMSPQSVLYILEPLIDQQRFAGSTFVLQLTSLYFAVMANGNSRMYSSAELTHLASRAGLEVREISSGFGICQSLMALALPA